MGNDSSKSETKQTGIRDQPNPGFDYGYAGFVEDRIEEIPTDSVAVSTPYNIATPWVVTACRTVLAFCPAAAAL